MWAWLKSFFKKAVDPKTIAAIQANAVTACGFLPTAETVANIVAAGNPGVVSATVVANAICGAINAAPKIQTLEGPAPAGEAMLNGVKIDGVYVKR